jgi:CRP-like cAMP-binding protein
MDNRHIDLITRRLEAIGAVTGDQRDALSRLRARERRAFRGQDLIEEGDKPSECMLVLSGFLYSYKMLADGKRQIVAFHVPGDIPDLQSLFIETMDFSLASSTDSIVAVIPHDDLRVLLASQPSLVNLFWRDTLIMAATFRTWVMATGRLDSSEHLAHLLCELHARYKAVGLTQDKSFALPVTQSELADAMGLSAVHANRTVQSLRAAGMVEMEAGHVTILDLERLQTFAQFDPTYLHLKHPTTYRRR